MQVITFIYLFFKLAFQLMETNLWKPRGILWGEGKDWIWEEGGEGGQTGKLKKSLAFLTKLYLVKNSKMLIVMFRHVFLWFLCCTAENNSVMKSIAQMLFHAVALSLKRLINYWELGYLHWWEAPSGNSSFWRNAYVLLSIAFECRRRFWVVGRVEGWLGFHGWSLPAGWWYWRGK